jgi:hypothetical protein
MEGTGENHRSEILYHIMLYRVHLDIIQYVLCPITFPRKVPISVQETELRIRELLCVFGYALSISDIRNTTLVILLSLLKLMFYSIMYI